MARAFASHISVFFIFYIFFFFFKEVGNRQTDHMGLITMDLLRVVGCPSAAALNCGTIPRFMRHTSSIINIRFFFFYLTICYFCCIELQHTFLFIYIFFSVKSFQSKFERMKGHCRFSNISPFKKQKTKNDG